MDKNEFICDSGVMVEFIQKLTEATERHRIVWHRNDFNAYYVTSGSNPRKLDRFSIFFSFDKETDAIRIYIDNLYKTYTPADVELWEYLKTLERHVQEYVRSVEATIQSMMEDLSKMTAIP